MSLPNLSPTSSAPQLVVGTSQSETEPNSDQFVDRRQSGDSLGASERRQFGSSHQGLTEDGRELALAIDRYKAEFHRRYITCDEMLKVLTSLGYSKQA
ncbi:MAG: hypothetical protein AB8B91_09860 [Rubripirellula sp.]